MAKLSDVVTGAAHESALGVHAVTMVCGCGRTFSIRGEKCDSPYDLRDLVERALSDHWLAEEIDGVCRQWIA